MIRLFIANTLSIGQKLSLSTEQSHYLMNVMRCKIQDTLHLFNGQDGEFCFQITDIGKQGVRGTLIECILGQKKLPPLTLIFAPIKQDRLSFMIEKATELGVTHFQPVLTKYTSMKRVNCERILRIATEASEQCERMCVPTCGELMPLMHYMQDKADDIHIAFAYERLMSEGGTTPFDEKLNALLIGPEGGFSADEVLLLRKKCSPISLGALILRAETAAIVGLDRLRR
ncbi:MAG TPA: 16S rRNA (uracil(1498)-N(3))-methyltransferase [Holosporales bacterium]|nr:16S rRNA (uracil(1498)-N(3))-methyltransferase [Holosporales bacterium]